MENSILPTAYSFHGTPGHWLGNLRNFSYIISNDNVCHNKDIFLIIVIPSHPNHAVSRNILRKAYNRRIYGKHCKVVFLMGHIKDYHRRLKIEEQNYVNEDIIMGNFPDGYHNITYHHLHGLKWATQYCSKAKYIMKVDDDIFVNLFKILKKLLNDRNRFRNNLFCGILTNTKPFRNHIDKYYMSFEEYPRDTYPTYCNGWSVVYSNNVARQIIDMSTKVPLVWISDVFVTGLVVERLPSVGFIDMYPNYSTDYNELLWWLYESDEFLDVFVGPTEGDISLLAALHYKTDSLHGY